MSASEWQRIIDERDEAVYHLNAMISLGRDCNLDEDDEFIAAEKWLDEYEGEE